MSTISRKRGAPDDNEIDPTKASEQQRWAEKLGVTTHQLQEAVKAVGTKAEDVERYLRGRAQSSRSA
jgi:uncharacterized protein DUF3606